MVLPTAFLVDPFDKEQVLDFYLQRQFDKFKLFLGDLVTAGGGVLGSGSFTLDDGTATAGGVFSFDDGAA